MGECPSPFVFWAQTKSVISLRIDLKDAKSPTVALHPDRMSFSAFGKGARGEHKYSFALNFFSKVEPNDSSYKVFDRQIEFSLKKLEPSFWPRLTGSPQKPAWLKIDFDKWKFDDPEIDDEESRNVIDDYPDLYNKLQKEERGYRIEDYKKVYLVLYNLCQLVGFTYILTVMAVRYSRDGEKSMAGTYENTGTVVKLCHLFMWLEVLHPLFGYTRNKVSGPFLQVSGRCIILFWMIEGEPRMQTKPVVFYLFLIWSLIEVIRYPYYISRLNNIEVPKLTWLRYTIWIPLYPLGMLCEGVIILRNIPYFEETLRFTIDLPNAWNFSFHSPTMMRLYLLFVLFPCIYIMMSNMYKERCKKLGIKSFGRKYL